MYSLLYVYSVLLVFASVSAEFSKNKIKSNQFRKIYNSNRPPTTTTENYESDPVTVIDDIEEDIYINNEKQDSDSVNSGPLIGQYFNHPPSTEIEDVTSVPEDIIDNKFINKKLFNPKARSLNIEAPVTLSIERDLEDATEALFASTLNDKNTQTHRRRVKKIRKINKKLPVAFNTNTESSVKKIQFEETARPRPPKVSTRRRKIPKRVTPKPSLPTEIVQYPTPQSEVTEISTLPTEVTQKLSLVTEATQTPTLPVEVTQRPITVKEFTKIPAFTTKFIQRSSITEEVTQRSTLTRNSFRRTTKTVPKEASQVQTTEKPILSRRGPLRETTQLPVIPKQVQQTITQEKANSNNNEPLLYKSDRHSQREKTPVIPIIDSENYVFGHSGNFHYSYEGGDGTKAYSKGVLKSSNNSTGEAVEGGFSYTDEDGNDFKLSYTADENGYRPVGAHLPTPPPIPPAIQRALDYLATKTTPEPVTEKIKPTKNSRP